MGYLTEDAYRFKAQYAANLAYQNRLTLNDEALADKLDSICDMRHELHANLAQKAERLYNIQTSEHDMLWEYYLTLNDLTGNTLPSNIEDMPYSEDPYQGLTKLQPEDYRRESVEFYINLIEKLNKKVEMYLSDFDKKHGTSYCPTGLSRRF